MERAPSLLHRPLNEVSDKCPLSVVLIVKNEERRLPDCLKSVEWAREIIIVDDESTDETVAIASLFTEKIFRRKMDVEGRHRNYAISKASENWILSIDADERVSPELALEIKKVVQKENGECAGYAIPIKTFLGGRWLKAAGYYPARKLRLFRQGHFRFEEAEVHPRIFFQGQCGDLDGDILHYPYKNWSEFIHKIDRDTTLEAGKWVVDGRGVTLGNTLRKVADRFLKNFFLKGGWRDGFYGFLLSYFHSFYQLMSYAKYRQMKEETRNRKPE